MSFKITEKIKQRAYDLITQLYGEDSAKIRRHLMAFHAEAMKMSLGADSIVDPILLRLVTSKYTTLIVVVVSAATLGAGYFLGTL